jgi:hypothetical protein
MSDDIDWLFPDRPDIVETIKKVRNTPEGEQLNKMFGNQKREPEPKEKKVPVPLGTYTLVLSGDSQPWRTIRVEPWNNRPLVNVFAMLVGPDNGLDFQGFGSQEGTQSFKVWRKFSTRDEWIRAAEALVIMATDPEGLEAAGVKYASVSTRCRRCNRKLTVPVSIHRGYGPDCAEKVGIL